MIATFFLEEAMIATYGKKKYDGATTKRPAGVHHIKVNCFVSAKPKMRPPRMLNFLAAGWVSFLSVIWESRFIIGVSL
jgi:hypothetical protein